MGYLIKREMRYKRGDMLRDWLMQTVPALVCMAACILASEALKVFGTYVYMLPEPAYRLLGIAKETNYDYWFYIKIIIMFSNIYIMWNVCSDVFYVVDRDEKNGSLFFMCSQMYSRKAIIVSKYIASAVSFMVTYIFWFAGMMLMGVAAGIKSHNIFDKMKLMLPMMYGGIAVGILLISVTYIYAVYKRQKDEYQYSAFICFILFGTLTVGNLYKIKDVLLWMMDYLKKTQPGFFTKLAFLDKLRWVSPLSWINPFVVHDMKEWLIMTLAAVVISAGSVAAAVFLYERRTIDY